MTPTPSAPGAAVPSGTERPPDLQSSPPVVSAGPHFARDSLVEVVTDDLRVRTKPGVSDDSIKLEPLLWAGAWAWVIDGPVTASGYEWYLLEPLSEVDLQLHPDPPHIGWVAAAGKDGEQWLAERSIECFSSPLGWLAYELDYPPHGRSALACFGGSTLEFTAVLGQQSVLCGDPAWRLTPSWLGECELRYTLADPQADASFEIHVLPVAIDPDLDAGMLATLGSGAPILVDVEGQYDHPAAHTCAAEPANASSEPAPDPRIVVADCRAKFVITAIRVRSG
jgi:hypothetical protein